MVEYVQDYLEVGEIWRNWLPLPEDSDDDSDSEADSLDAYLDWQLSYAWIAVSRASLHSNQVHLTFERAVSCQRHEHIFEEVCLWLRRIHQLSLYFTAWWIDLGTVVLQLYESDVLRHLHKTNPNISWRGHSALLKGLLQLGSDSRVVSYRNIQCMPPRYCNVGKSRKRWVILLL